MGGDGSTFRHLLVGILLGVVLAATFPAIAASVGDPLKLGKANRLDEKTTLKGDAQGANLQVQATGNRTALLVRASKNAIRIRVEDGKAPINVNASAGKARNLDADQVDGKDAADFLGVDDTAADSHAVGGLGVAEVAPESLCEAGSVFVGFGRTGVTCAPAMFQFQIVDDEAAQGQYTSIVLDGMGNPVISYYDVTNTALRVAHCNDPACSGADESVETVENENNDGLYTSLALDAAGNPVIAYRDGTNSALKVTHCNDPNCNGGDESTEIVDNEGNDGEHASLALDADGNPVIAYRDGTNSALKVIHCNDPNCEGGDESPETVDNTGNDGEYVSLVLDADGNPVISYRSDTELKLAHCADPSCDGTPSVEVVDGATNVGLFTSLVLDADGNPVISYQDGLNTDLKLAHCNDPNCSGGDESLTTVDDAENVGFHTSLVLDAYGNPVISYRDGDNTALKVAFCNDPDCAGGDEKILTVDDTANEGEHTSIVLDAAGNPIIAYYGATSSALKVASM